jgi:hypothetical protein
MLSQQSVLSKIPRNINNSHDYSFPAFLGKVSISRVPIILHQFFFLQKTLIELAYNRNTSAFRCFISSMQRLKNKAAANFQRNLHIERYHRAECDTTAFD